MRTRESFSQSLKVKGHNFFPFPHVGWDCTPLLEMSYLWGKVGVLKTPCFVYDCLGFEYEGDFSSPPLDEIGCLLLPPF
jgi:hypothetical protein